MGARCACVKPPALGESRIFHHYVLYKLLALAVTHGEEDNQEIGPRGSHFHYRRNGKTNGVD